MQVAASIFKAYDIRGIVGQTLSEAMAEHLGRAFGTEALKLGEKAVAVGRDGRVSGPSLSSALIAGLRSTGINVIDLGAVTTPMLYYVAATRGEQGCHSGIQVTGSHNPKDYNGFKMVLAGRAIYGDDIQGLRQRIEAEDYVQGSGALTELNVLAEYTQRIIGDCKLARPMKIVVDSGNGIPGASAPGILRALDGRFLRPAPGGDLLRTPEELLFVGTPQGVDGNAPFGIIGLETAFAVCLAIARTGAFSEKRLIEALTSGPARAFGLPGGTLARGARMGAERFFTLIWILSVALAVLNLLPLPPLDGGKLVFLLWELVTGRRASERIEAAVSWVGFLLLATLLLGVTIFGDIPKLLR